MVNAYYLSVIVGIFLPEGLSVYMISDVVEITVYLLRYYQGGFFMSAYLARIEMFVIVYTIALMIGASVYGVRKSGKGWFKNFF